LARRADTRRSWCVTPHCESRVSQQTNVVQPGAAGVSQPWYANVPRRRKTVACAGALLNHGGLTPAALGRMYVCASQKSLFRRQTFAPQRKSGGRKPPVAPMHAIVIRTRMTHKRFRRYVSPVAPINATATVIRTHTVGGLLTNGAGLCGCGFVHPRRADARRSWR
jgi:hypothetical protein